LPLQPGTRLGVYEILAAIGARDSRLKARVGTT